MILYLFLNTLCCLQFKTIHVLLTKLTTVKLFSRPMALIACKIGVLNMVWFLMLAEQLLYLLRVRLLIVTNYKLCNNRILCFQFTQDLASSFGPKVLFSSPNWLHIFQGLKRFSVILYITSSLSDAHNVCVLCFILVRPKMQYASASWICITSSDSSNRKECKENLLPFAMVIFVDVFCDNFVVILVRLNTLTLYLRPCHLDSISF
jgi:hypothetical protein